MILVWRLFLAIGLSCFAVSSIALDQQRLLRSDGVTPFRYWDNLEGAPYWLSGEVPRYHYDEGLHSIHLEPGSTTLIRLPVREGLRLRKLGGPLLSEELLVELSNGSSLFIETTLQPGSDDSWNLMPEGRGERLVRLSRPASYKNDIEIILYVSRMPELPPLARYRQLPSVEGEVARLQEQGKPVGQPVWSVDQIQSIEIEIEGPQRLKLESWLRYSGAVNEPRQLYRLLPELDGVVTPSRALYGRADLHRRWLLDGCLEVLGLSQQVYVDIPEGRHKLKLRASTSVLMRLHGRPEAGDFLLQRNQFHSLTKRPPQPGVTESMLVDLGHLARDNRQSGTTALALDSVDRLSDSAPMEREWVSESQALDGRHGFFRPLFPYNKPDATALSVLWPAKSQLRWDDQHPLLIPESLQSNLAKGIGGRQFLTLPEGQDKAYLFHLPVRNAASRLRLLVGLNKGEENQEIFLQLNQQPPRKLIQLPNPPLPKEAYWPDPAMAARMLSMDGAALISHTTAVADLELPLPADINTVRLWQSSNNSQPVVLALDMRMAGHHAANEPEYRFLIDELKPETHQQMLQQSLVSIAQLAKSQQAIVHLFDSIPANDSSTEKTLLNDWLPLLRFLYSRYSRFVAMVERPLPLLRSEKGVDLPLQELRRQAEQAVIEQDWVRAIEAWSAMLPHAGDEVRRHALMQRISGLKARGEGYLAELQLRGMLIHGLDRVLQDEAAKELALGYEKNQNDQGRIDLAVTRAILSPQPDRLVDLAWALIRDGHPDWATKILLSLPKGQRPPSILLQASYTAGWWRTFDLTLGALQDRQIQALWQGYQAQLFGNFDRAVSAWKNGGSRGKALIKSLQRGLDLRRQLGVSERPGKVLLHEWADWWDKQPGERRWRSIDSDISDFDGVETLYIPDQDLTFRAFRSLRDSPVKLTIQGPRRLRFIARPLHSNPTEAPIDDWLLVSDGTEKWYFPINGNRVTNGVRLTHGSTMPGQSHSFELSVGPGSHQLTLSPHQNPLLLKVEALSPLQPLSVLSEPSPDVASMPYVDSIDAKLIDPFPGQDVQWVKACAKVAHQTETVEFEDTAQERGEPLHTTLLSTPESLSGTDENDQKIYQQMAQWLWQAEQYPDRALPVLAQAEALFAQHATRTELQGIIRRLRRFAVWRPLDDVLSSAGQHYIQQTQFHPESAGLRIRNALLEPLLDGERLIYAGQRLGIALHNPSAPSTITLTFKLQELAYVDARNLSARYRVDEGEHHVVHLTPDQPSQRVQVRIPQGRHLLRVEMLDPVQNQILRLGLASKNQLMEFNGDRVQERAYQVATQDEPVELALEGPVWIRVDEADGGQTRSRYLFVEPGWRELQLLPRSGQQESLYRLFYQQPVTESKQSLPRERRHFQPNMMPVSQNPELMLPVEPIEDFLPMSNQEDGTWSFYGRLASRRNLDEDRDNNRSERFVELGVTHRLFQQAADRYLESGMLMRVRETGGPTLGLNGRMRWQSDFRAITLDLQGDLFLQQPESDIGVEGAMVLKAALSQHRQLDAKSHHRPTLSLFQRWLSMDRVPEVASESVDQDIFTRYKGDHQRGVKLGDTFTHYPWRDNRLRASLSLTSNEALNPFDPDHADFTLGADQLVGDLNLGLSYRWRHYFDDDDRSDNSNQHNLRLRLDWRRWSTPHRGWHVGLNLDHELDSGDTSVFITLSNQRANGRFYRDYRQGAVAFESLRTRHELERHFPSSEADQ